MIDMNSLREPSQLMLNESGRDPLGSVIGCGLAAFVGLAFWTLLFVGIFFNWELAVRFVISYCVVFVICAIIYLTR